MALKTTWLFKCVDCGTKNKTDYPPLDNVTHCSKCGFATVQVCEAVKHTNAPEVEMGND